MGVGAEGAFWLVRGSNPRPTDQVGASELLDHGQEDDGVFDGVERMRPVGDGQKVARGAVL